MNVGIVVAAGSSRRFKSQTPKVLAKLKGKPVLQWSVEVFLKHPQIEGIIVVMPKNYVKEVEELFKFCPKLKAVIKGGKERYHSVYEALKFCYKNFESTQNVLIHDGARPFVEAIMFDRLLASLNENSAATLAIPAWELVVKTTVDNPPHVAEFPDRQHMYLVQTPQAFHFKKLYAAYEKFEKLSPDLKVYDDCGLFQWAFPQEPIAIVEGHRRNIKITQPLDLSIAEILTFT